MPEKITNRLSRSILEELQNVYNFLNDPSFEFQSEMQSNSECIAAMTKLSRLTSSMKQYFASQSAQNRYISLIGHFSSGKSSTINSILGGSHRATDLNPTDRGVTFICSPDTKPNLIAAESNADFMINIESVRSAILEDVIFIDTPGLAETQVLTSIAEDILPISNLVLYCISAASPFDESDIPILTHLTEELEHVEIIVVITRSDELGEVVDGQFKFDLDSKKVFENRLTSRLIDHGIDLNSANEKFHYVDNRSGFGVKELWQRIKETEIDKAESHLKTLHFFRSSATRAIRKIESFLQNIENSTIELFETAGKNKEDFQNEISFEVDELLSAWAASAERVAKTGQNELDSIKKLQYDLAEIREKFNLSSSHILESRLPPEWIDHAVFDVIRRFRTIALSDFKSRILDTPDKIIDLEAVDELARKTVLDMKSHDAGTENGEVRELIHRIAMELVQSHIGALGNLESEVISITKKLQDPAEKTLESLNNENNAARLQLDASIKKLGIKANIYRAAVFSHKNLRILSETGIAKSLDQEQSRDLEQQLHNSQKLQLIKSVSLTSAINSSIEVNNLARTAVMGIEDQFKLDLSDLEISPKLAPLGDLKQNVFCQIDQHLDDLLLELVRPAKAKTKHAVDLLREKLDIRLGKLDSKRRREKLENSLIYRSLVKRTGTAIVVFGFVGAASWFLFVGNSSPSSLATYMTGMVITTLAPPFLAYVFGTSVRKKLYSLKEAERFDVREVVGSHRWPPLECDLRMKSEIGQIISAVKSKVVHSTLDSCNVLKAAFVMHEAVVALDEVRMKVNATHATLVSNATSALNEDSTKQKLLSSIGAAFSDAAIKPSFDEIQSYKNKIASVRARLKELGPQIL